MKEEMNGKRKLIQKQFAEINEKNGQVHLLMEVITDRNTHPALSYFVP
jgi:hypothetical protein